jgi:hypothetical protein
MVALDPLNETGPLQCPPQGEGGRFARWRLILSCGAGTTLHEMVCPESGPLGKDENTPEARGRCYHSPYGGRAYG